MVLSGRVVSGRREAAGFTQLEWVRDRFLDAVGIDPYPGTLNLSIDEENLRAWTALKKSGGYRIEPAIADFCAARCYAVRVNDRVPAAVVVPEVDTYSPTQLELVAAISLREALSVSDDSVVTVEAWVPWRVRAVIFDVDGTLVDSLAAFRIVAERACAPHGLTITDAMVREALNTTRQFWDVALPADIPDRTLLIDALRREAARLWPDILREHGRLVADVAVLLRTLAGRGARLGIMTGSRRGSLDALRDANLLDLFDVVVTGGDVRAPKPDPEGLRTCAEKLGVDSREAVYVGDTPLDMRAARAAGMVAAGVLTGAASSAELSLAGADRLFRSPAALPDALEVLV